ncbi:Phospholipase C, partial [Serendipita sp. 399]
MDDYGLAGCVACLAKFRDIGRQQRSIPSASVEIKAFPSFLSHLNIVNRKANSNKLDHKKTSDHHVGKRKKVMDRLKESKYAISSKAKETRRMIMAMTGAQQKLERRKREKADKKKGDGESGEEEWELDGIKVPRDLIKGTILTKISEKKGKSPKDKFFRLDADQGKVIWESKRRGVIHIENIKELRAGPSAHSEISTLLPEQDPSKIEDRWLTVIYTIEDEYKTLHVITPTTQLFEEWYTTLVLLRQLRLDFMAGVFHASSQESELWERHHFSGADKSKDNKLSYSEVKNLCRRLNFGGTDDEVKRRFTQADVGGKGYLTYEEFRDFVRSLRERTEITTIYEEIKKGGPLTFEVFEAFMKDCQKPKNIVQSTLSKDDLEKIYQSFLPSGPQKDTGSGAPAPRTWSLGSFSLFLQSSYSGAFSETLELPPSSDDVTPVKLTTLGKGIWQDMTQPISSYFICSSHNTYLIGNQLVGDSSVEGYIRALLGGCRSVEMDIYDGPSDGVGVTAVNAITTEVDDLKEDLQQAVSMVQGAVDDEKNVAGIKGTAGVDAKDLIPGEPIITHGGTLTSSVSLRKVCEAIERYAFVTSPYPVIISGEVHCCIEQQKVLVNIMREVFGDKLVVAPIEGYDADILLPSPEALKGRILLKAKHKTLDASSRVTAQAVDEAEEEEEEENEQKEKAEKSRDDSKRWSSGMMTKMGKMFGLSKSRSPSRERTEKELVATPEPGAAASMASPESVPAATTPGAGTSLNPPALVVEGAPITDPAPNQPGAGGGEMETTAKPVMASELVPLLVYSSGVTFRGLSPTKAYSASQVFSLSENKAKSLIHNPRQANVKDSLKSSAKDSALLIQHTQGHVVRVYPKGTRVDSSNYEPNVFWAMGCQLTTLNWQTVDRGWHINQAMYLRNGGAGYVLKPPALLDPSYPTDLKKHRLTKHILRVRIISAQQLPRPKDQQGHEIVDKDTVDPYVKVTIHIPIWAGGQSSDSVAPVPVQPVVSSTSVPEGSNPQIASVVPPALTGESKEKGKLQPGEVKTS